jgi:hypothetical protein
MIRLLLAVTAAAILTGCQVTHVSFGAGMEKGSGGEVRVRAADAQSVAAAAAIYQFTPQTERAHFEDFEDRRLTFDFGIGFTKHLAIEGGLHLMTASEGTFRAGSGVNCFRTCRPQDWSVSTDLYEYSLPLQLVGRWNVPRVPHLQWFAKAGATYSFLQIETDVCGFWCQTGVRSTDVHYAKDSSGISPIAGIGLEWRFVSLAYSIRQVPVVTGWSGTPGGPTSADFERPRLNLTLGEKEFERTIGLMFFWRGDPNGNYGHGF